MDYGCSSHMTPKRDLFFDYKSIDGGKVPMENNMSFLVTGICSIKFRMWDGTIKVLSNV